MLKIGVTGGIGSGKSVVAKIIESLNYPVFYSDSVAKELIDSDDSIKAGLIDLFGKELYAKGTLDKAALANYIFTNPKAKEKVNALIHPKVRIAFEEFAQKNQELPFVFNEAAILFETGGHINFDKIIIVTAPEEIRIKRVQERDGVTRTQVLDRMNNQWSDERKVPLADFQIINDGERPVIEQVESVLKKLLK